MHNLLSKLERDTGDNTGGIRKMRKVSDEKKKSNFSKDYTKERQRRRADEKRAHLTPKPSY